MRRIDSHLLTPPPATPPHNTTTPPNHTTRLPLLHCHRGGRRVGSLHTHRLLDSTVCVAGKCTTVSLPVAMMTVWVFCSRLEQQHVVLCCKAVCGMCQFTRLIPPPLSSLLHRSQCQAMFAAPTAALLLFGSRDRSVGASPPPPQHTHDAARVSVCLGLIVLNPISRWYQTTRATAVQWLHQHTCDPTPCTAHLQTNSTPHTPSTA
jgi:hypothetical protein